MKSRFAVLLAASAAFGFAHAQTKWDMPTPYADGEFHTRNIKAFVEDVKKGTGGEREGGGRGQCGAARGVHRHVVLLRVEAWMFG